MTVFRIVIKPDLDLYIVNNFRLLTTFEETLTTRTVAEVLLQQASETIPASTSTHTSVFLHKQSRTGKT